MFYSQYVNTIVSLVIVVFTTGIIVQEVMVSNYFPIDIVIKIRVRYGIGTVDISRRRIQ